MVAVADINPPTLTSLLIRSELTDESGYDGVKLIAEASIADDLSGFMSASIQIKSPSGKSEYITFRDADRISGDETSGTYITEHVLREFSEGGDWQIGYIDFRDDANNYRAIRGHELEELGFSSIVTIPATGTDDLNPPTLTSLLI